MAKSSEASRQRRARENRARRARLEARTQAAAKPRPDKSSRPDSEPSSKADRRAERRGGRAESKSDETAETTGRRPAAQRPGMVPVDIETLQGSWIRKVVTVPGGIQVLMSVVLTVVMTVMSAFTRAFPAEGAPDDSELVRTIFDVHGVGALMFLAPPVLIVGNAAIYALHAKRRRIWIFSAVAMALFSLFGPQYLFPAGFLAYAVLRARKVEDGPSAADIRRAQKAQQRADKREAKQAEKASG